jgi:hypothetical protein
MYVGNGPSAVQPLGSAVDDRRAVGRVPEAWFEQGLIIIIINLMIQTVVAI